MNMKYDRVITSVSLPASLVDRIDKKSKEEMRTRSNMIECLLLDALIMEEKKNEEKAEKNQ